jgi:putative SOS response-associated peptidase YedK
VLGWLHNRIPCLLTTDESVAAWLDPATPVPAALAALQLPPAETIAWHPVATAVGNVRQCAASGIKFFRNGIRPFSKNHFKR